jgi:hypothetical protein
MSSHSLLRAVARTTTRVAGYSLIGVGGVLALSPLPTGAVLMGVGAAVLIPTDRGFRNWLRDRRRRWDWLDTSLHHVGKRTPGRFGRYLRR